MNFPFFFYCFFLSVVCWLPNSASVLKAEQPTCGSLHNFSQVWGVIQWLLLKVCIIQWTVSNSKYVSDYQCLCYHTVISPNTDILNIWCLTCTSCEWRTPVWMYTWSSAHLYVYDIRNDGAAFQVQTWMNTDFRFKDHLKALGGCVCLCVREGHYHRTVNETGHLLDHFRLKWSYVCFNSLGSLSGCCQHFNPAGFIIQDSVQHCCL